MILRPLGYPERTGRVHREPVPQHGVRPVLGCRRRSSWSSRSGAQLLVDRWFATTRPTLSATDRPRRVNNALVSAGLFKVLGVNPMLGRAFDQSETLPNGPTGRDPLVGDMAVGVRRQPGHRRLAGRESHQVKRTIVASCRRVSTSPIINREWLPLASTGESQNRGSHFLHMIGLAPGATFLRARKQSSTPLLGAWPATIPPAPNANFIHTPDPKRHRLRYDPRQLQIAAAPDGGVRASGPVVFVLLIACANLRTCCSRERQFAAQGRSRALGARRWPRHAAASIQCRGLSVVILGSSPRARCRGDRSPRPDRRVSRTACRARRRHARRRRPRVYVLIGLLTGAVFGLAPPLHCPPTRHRCAEGGARDDRWRRA